MTANQLQSPPMVAGELNRLLQTLSRSLALYVDEIKPWSLAADEPVWTAIARGWPPTAAATPSEWPRRSSKAAGSRRPGHIR